MPNIPNIQTIVGDLHQDTATTGGFARANQFQVYIGNGWGTEGSTTPFLDHLSNPSLSPIYGFDWNQTFQRKLAIKSMHTLELILILISLSMLIEITLFSCSLKHG